MMSSAGGHEVRRPSHRETCNARGQSFPFAGGFLNDEIRAMMGSFFSPPTCRMMRLR
ncbi:MAG: hypothetical protein ACJAT3_002337 [Akkermansiaceae bacterium]